MTFLIQQTLIYAIPLMIVALAGVFAERSGIINLALEGIMIFGAFIGVMFVRIMQASGGILAAKAAGDWVTLQGLELLAMLAAGIMGAIFSLLLSFASINLRADQTIGGTALNMMAPALVLFLVRIIANQNTLQMATGDSASWFMIKKSTLGIDKNTDLGFFGETFLNKTYIATYICIILFVVLSIILYKTKFGLRLRACGENPQAADSLGINVYKMRYAGTTISGFLAGMGGFVYALTTANCTANGDVAGFGFLALAVMIFGNWKPLNIAGASLLFGLFKCVAAAYSSIDINGDGVYWLAEIGVSSHLYRMLPYIITLVVLAFTSKKSREPKAEGIPYDKSQRYGATKKACREARFFLRFFTLFYGRSRLTGHAAAMEMAACSALPMKYRFRERPLPLSTAAVWQCTDSPPQPKRPAAHMKPRRSFASRRMPLVISTMPNMAPCCMPVKRENKRRMTRKNTTKAQMLTILMAPPRTAWINASAHRGVSVFSGRPIWRDVDRNSSPTMTAAPTWMRYSHAPTLTLPKQPRPAIPRINEGPALLQKANRRSHSSRSHWPLRYSSPAVRPPTG